MARAASRAKKGSGAQAALFSPEQLAPIPDTGWRTPTEWPRVRHFDHIAIDLETYDPELTTRGPGWATGNGHIVGIAVGTPDGNRHYMPIRHEVGGGNLDARMVLKWAREELTRPGQLKIGANLMYDLGWLLAEGVEVPGPFYDVQWAEALLDEHRDSYSLENIARDTVGAGKDSSAMYEWAARAYGGQATAKAQAANIHRIPACLVGPYAESDVDLPLRIREQQKPRLAADGLESLCEMEHRLLPVLLAMKKRGVRVDMAARDRLSDMLQEKERAAQKQLGNVNVYAADELAQLFASKGIGYPKTATGRPSFTDKWLKECQAPAAALVREVRKTSKLRGTFVDGYFEFVHGGRIRPNYHPLRADDGGTVSGRMASSQINMQNIPARDPEWGKPIRSLFVPDDGEDWAKCDYAQIEPRLTLHYAHGHEAERVRAMYADDPALDCYMAMIQQMGTTMERGPFKAIFLGLSYNMGRGKLAREMGLSDKEAEWQFAEFHAGAPYIRDLNNAAVRAAGNRGQIRTLLGRLARFPQWEAADYDIARRDGAMSEEEARRRYGARVRRAWTHKAMNRLIQGGAADIMKKAVVDCWESGICDVLGAPLALVHDEIDWSVPRTAEGREALQEAKRIMETCVTLKVPLVADVETGPNWGSVK